MKFRLGQDWVRVTAVLDRWLAREHRYYKVSVGTERYIFRHDVPNGVWDLTFFLANVNVVPTENAQSAG